MSVCSLQFHIISTLLSFEAAISNSFIQTIVSFPSFSWDIQNKWQKLLHLIDTFLEQLHLRSSILDIHFHWYSQYYKNMNVQIFPLCLSSACHSHIWETPFFLPAYIRGNRNVVLVGWRPSCSSSRTAIMDFQRIWNGK